MYFLVMVENSSIFTTITEDLLNILNNTNNYVHSKTKVNFGLSSF